MKLAHLAVLGVTWTLAPLATADLIVVDPGGGGQFTTLAAAVQAASDGDVLRVKAGTYAGFDVFNKGLTISSEGPNFVVVAGGTRVVGLAAHKTVVLNGIHFRGTTTPLTAAATPGLSVLSSLGAVRIQDCIIEGANLPIATFCGDALEPWPGLIAEGSPQISLVDSLIRGGRGHTYPGYPSPLDCYWLTAGNGGPGLRSIHSSVVLHGCEIFGGLSGAGSYSGAGGAGVEASGTGSLTIIDSTVKGGNGQPNNDLLALGVDGVGATAMACLVPWYESGSTFASGWGGGGQQPPIAGFAPTVWPARVRTLETPPLVTPGYLVYVSVLGAPGDVALLLVGGGPAQVPLPLQSSVLALQVADVLVLGPVDATGTVAVGATLGAMPPGTAAVRSLQAVLVEPNGSFWLTNPRSLVLTAN